MLGQSVTVMAAQELCIHNQEDLLWIRRLTGSDRVIYIFIHQLMVASNKKTYKNKN